MAELIDPTAGAADARDRWLRHMAAIKGARPATLSAYRSDIDGFLSFLGQHWGGSTGIAGLGKINMTDLRAWMSRLSFFISCFQKRKCRLNSARRLLTKSAVYSTQY